MRYYSQPQISSKLGINRAQFNYLLKEFNVEPAIKEIAEGKTRGVVLYDDKNLNFLKLAMALKNENEGFTYRVVIQIIDLLERTNYQEKIWRVTTKEAKYITCDSKLMELFNKLIVEDEQFTFTQIKIPQSLLNAQH